MYFFCKSAWFSKQQYFCVLQNTSAGEAFMGQAWASPTLVENGVYDYHVCGHCKQWNTINGVCQRRVYRHCEQSYTIMVCIYEHCMTDEYHECRPVLQTMYMCSQGRRMARVAPSPLKRGEMSVIKCADT